MYLHCCVYLRQPAFIDIRHKQASCRCTQHCQWKAKPAYSAMDCMSSCVLLLPSQAMQLYFAHSQRCCICHHKVRTRHATGCTHSNHGLCQCAWGSQKVCRSDTFWLGCWPMLGAVGATTGGRMLMVPAGSGSVPLQALHRSNACCKMPPTGCGACPGP